MSDSGAVAVHGAKVTAVSGSTITAQTAFGATVLSWTVDTNNSTSFAPKGNASNTLSNVKAGDYISFSGTLDSAAANLTVTANTIRDYSLLPVSGDLSGNAMLSGTVNSVNTSGNTFVLSTKDHGMVTVSVATSTALLNGDGSFLLGNLALGNSVMVKGSY
ncbi:MAG: hypothetical protein JO026_00635, partial [Patescibacteria group bacterium]|nr:hypothetical protein [Patescibacteria group bacterium]